MADKIKQIPEQKLKAFSIGTMGKRALSKREIEEQRRKEQEEAAAHVFQEFVETFQDSQINGTKVWVKAGTYDAGARKEDTREKGKLYKPQSRLVPQTQENLSSAERAQEYARLLAGDRKPERLGKKKPQSKSNLESFKEELRQIQEEREERHKYKGVLRNPIESELDLFVKVGDNGSFDNGDPTTTNLYLGNLNPKITEQQLMEVFGRFGPLASIKIMWPRSDEEKARGRNCGFVAYMSRKDGERALRNLNGKDVLGYEMKLGWGKSVIIPPHPIYIPPTLLELSMPPPPSGLPFNAQPCPKDRDALPQTAEELNQILSRSIVKVVIPTDRNLLMLIHRMVEFVIREGPMFEAMIMNREINNPLFRFLFENQSPAHIYYRWKLYSLMNGDSQKEWNTKEIRMFKGGSIWKPPVMNCYTSGMPQELVVDDDSKEPTKGSLSNTQRDRLEDLIRNLTPEAKKIGEVMVFCIEHSDAADEIAECLAESLANSHTIITKKIARLYLISDILHNCGVKVNKASFYRRAFEIRLVEILKNVRDTMNRSEGRLKAEGIKVRILRILKALEDSIYPRDFMTKLNNTFLGLDSDTDNEGEEEPAAHDIDGAPIEEDNETDEDAPMDGAALLKGAMKMRSQQSPASVGEEDFEGVPFETMPASSATSGFIPSKWETVDPDQVEAQAMTTSKWDQLENSGEDSQESQADNADSNEYNDPRNMTEERRTKLREIEVKAVQYQDELESGVRALKSGWTVSQQVEHYRRKLLKKAEKEKRASSKDKHRSRERKQREADGSSGEEGFVYKELTSSSRKNKKHARSSSGSSTKSRYRSKSRSPARKKTIRALTPPSPPRIRRHSPKSSASKYSAKSSLSPIVSGRSSGGKPYDSPSSNGSKYSQSQVSPARPSKYKGGRTPSPPPSSRSSKHSRRSSASPRRDSPRATKYRPASPEVSRKHRHKHKY